MGPHSLGKRTSPPQPLHWTELNETQNAVMNLLVQGATNAEIGAALDMGYQVVKNTVSQIYRIFGVHHRSHLIANAPRGRRAS